MAPTEFKDNSDKTGMVAAAPSSSATPPQNKNDGTQINGNRDEEDGGTTTTTEQSKKEQDAAAIMATLKPSSSVTATAPATQKPNELSPLTKQQQLAPLPLPPRGAKPTAKTKATATPNNAKSKRATAAASSSSAAAVAAAVAAATRSKSKASAATASCKNDAKLPKKKKKKPSKATVGGGGGSSSAKVTKRVRINNPFVSPQFQHMIKTAAAPASAAAHYRHMDDSELIQTLAMELKRRGYTVAIQLKPLGPAAAAGGAASGETGAEKEGNNGGSDNANAKEKKAEANDDGTNGTNDKSTNDSDSTDDSSSSNNKYPTFPFYPSTVSISQKNVNSWNKMYAILQKYHAENNGALPLHAPTAAATSPANTSNSQNRALCKWTKAQLTLWKRMQKDSKHNLNMERISKLHALDLERGEKKHLEIQDATMVSMLEKGQGSGADAANGDDEALTNGDTEGGSGEKNGKMLIPIPRAKQKWLDKFEELKKYKAAHGDCNVPRCHDDALSKWCSTQRLRCKGIMSGDENAKVGGMTQAQFQALHDIGFDMSSQRKIYDRTKLETKWEDKFNELLQYKAKFGNCDVAVRKGFEEYKVLANWAGLQRRKFKAKQTGTKAGRTTEISEEQIKKLASIGFSFSLQDDFDTRFKHLCEFKKEFGHTKVPVFYTGWNNLGRWAKRMRDGIRNNEPWMDEVRKTRLLGIDFDIAARHVFGHKPKNKKAEGDDDEEEDDNRLQHQQQHHHQHLDGVNGHHQGMHHQGIHHHGMKDNEFDDDEDMVQNMVEPVEAQAVAAATTMARMDHHTDFGRDFVRAPALPPNVNAMDGSQFFYHGYPEA